jgi:phosphatidylcholine synthase
VSTATASLPRRLAAWGVHLLTASSAPAGVLAVLAAERGDPAAAMWWMAYTVAVDAVDGTLARAVGVKQVLPYFDGTRLDDVVDYFTWVAVPVLFMLWTDLLPPAIAVPLGCAVVVASAYQFCRTDAKTSDHYFTGFPSYWNILAFYLYALDWPTAANAAVVVVFAVLIFVPIRYVYPSRTPILRTLTVGLGCAWGAAVLLALYQILRDGVASRPLVLGSLLFPVYYGMLSLALTTRRRVSR